MKYLALLAILLVGCTTDGPTHKPMRSEYLIDVRIYDDVNAVREAYAQNHGGYAGDVVGYSERNLDKCTIHYSHEDWRIFLHELKHCYYGNWHD